MHECRDNCCRCNDAENSENKSVLSGKQTWIILLVIAVCGIAFSFLNKSKKAENPVSKFTYPIMGTVCSVDFFEDKNIAENAAKAVYKELRDFEKMCNIFDPASEISVLNVNADKKPFICSVELYSLLNHCRAAHKTTGGAFDITAGPLMDLWGFYRKRKTLPSPVEISETLKLVGLNKVKFNDAERSVFFTVKGMSFDLGGIAKGAALDKAAQAAKNAGAKNFIINLGGNLACFGKIYDVGIRDPRKRNKIAGKIFLADAFCATSGNYERFVTINGKKYSHIMNPLTGYPVQNNICSTTVVASSGIDSDIFSTACFILGKEKANEFLNSRKINDYVFISISKNNSFEYSHGLNINNITKEVKK